MKPQTEEQWLMVLAVIERLYAEVRAGNWDGLRQMLHGYATSPPEPSVKPMPYTSHREALQDIADAYAARSELFTNDADCAANLADRARAGLRLSAEPGAGQWQPIETAPKDGTRVLCAFCENETPEVLYFSGGMWYSELEREGQASFIFQPTYWMPLPELPRFTPTKGESL